KKQLEESNNMLETRKKLIEKLEIENDDLQQTTEKLKVVHKDAMKLVASMTGISDTQQDLQTTADVLEGLAQIISEDKFKLMDINGDGFISKEEFMSHVNKMSRKKTKQ